MNSGAPVLIIPAKPPAVAKTRLTASGVLSAEEFAIAFLRDVLAAVLAADRFADALVVSEDDTVREVVEADGGTVVVPHVRSTREPIGIDAAVLRAAATADEVHGPGRRVVVVADLPALRPTDLCVALDEAHRLDRPAFVADAAGTGTTFLTAASSAALRPRFGPLSARRHQQIGHRAIRSAVPTLRRDVDVRDDLRAAQRLGLGRHTAELLQGLSRSASSPTAVRGR